MGVHRRGDPMNDKAAVDSANQMARAFMGSMVTFLVTISYLGVATASTSHAQLLTGREMRLPLLGVDVAVGWFFQIACWMTLILHVVVLLQVHLLFRKLRPIGHAVQARLPLVPAILVEAFFPSGQRKSTWWILRIVLVLPLFPIPWLVLTSIYLRFSDSRPPLAEQLVCVVALVLDAVVSWVFIHKILHPPRSVLGRPQRAQDARWQVLGLELMILLLGFLLLVPVVALEPQDCRSEARWLRALSWLEPCIAAADSAFVGPDRVASWLGAGAERRGSTARLAGSDLRGADLRRAELTGVDLRGADLRWAALREVRLVGADLGPLPPAGRDDAERPVVLSGTDLTGAVLHGARLFRADLSGADLTGADLRGVDLTGADLTGARMSGVRLGAARLRYADLRGAVLDRAELTCADLGGVRAEGVRAIGARGLGVELRSGLLIGSSWADAGLVGADLEDARWVGADLRGADLAWSRGLAPRKVDLRSARLARAVPQLHDAPPPARLLRGAVLTDARGAVWSEPGREPPSRAGLLPLRESLEAFPRALEWLDDCEARLDERLAASPPAAGPTPMQQVFRTPAARDNLGETRAATEGAYHSLLLRALADPLRPIPEPDPHACSSPELARSLVLRWLGCLGPRDPVFERRLGDRLRELTLGSAGSDGECRVLRDAYRRLPAEVRVRLEGDEEPRRPTASPADRFPRWSPHPGAPRVECDDLHRRLWG